jgi:signal transduction histidine kinase
MGNLLSNSLKFTPENGTITISAKMEKGIAPFVKKLIAQGYPEDTLPAEGLFLRLSVSDTGVGIPREALSTVFDRFVQAKSRRSGKTKGTGLGLAFCRKVMDSHHGYIWVESAEGVGSSFTALFPAVQ